MAGEARFLSNGAYPLTVQFSEENAFLWARCRDAGGFDANDLVGLEIRLVDENVQWAATKTLLSGDIFQPVGVVEHGVAQNGFVPVNIYGPVAGVTFPAGLTRTNANSAVRRGGAGRLNQTANYAVAPPEHALSFAEITDGKTGAQTVRDLFLYGRWVFSETLLRSVGQAHHTPRENDTPTQSVLIDGDQKGWIIARCDAGCTGGDLVMLRRGRTKTWTVTHGTGGVLADAPTDGIFTYGVAEHDVAAAAGATVRVQISGPVEADLRQAVNAATLRYLYWSVGNNTIATGSVPAHWKIFGAATEASTAQTQNIVLFGRQFTN